MNYAQQHLYSFISLVLLLWSSLTFFVAFRVEPSDAQCDRLSYSWSPALEEVDYHWETFEDIQFSFRTSYFGFEPTDELEAVWDELLPAHPISIPSSRLGDLGQSDAADHPDWTQDPQNSNAILALPEYAVQLGCLNFLRQLGHRSKRDFTYLEAFQGEDSRVWERAYQCIERLRQALMCWADSGSAILYHDGNLPPGGSPDTLDDITFDFGTLHYCRKFENIQKWTRDHGIESVTMNNLWWSGGQ